jgi:hypothetical protein
MWRRAAVVAAVLAMGASVGLAGAGVASAVTPALHVTGGSIWTTEITGAGCQLDLFKSNGHFHSPEIEFNGDAGTWSGGGSTIKMVWTKGEDTGLTFKGTYVKAYQEYTGNYTNGSQAYTGYLVAGAVLGC